jgi:hypothetical protein
MAVDEAIALEVLRESVAQGGYLLRIALCQRGREPLVVSSPRAASASSTELWDGLMRFLSGKNLVTVLARGTHVALADVAPGVVVAAEFVKSSHLGVAAVLADTAAQEISRRAIRTATS